MPTFSKTAPEDTKIVVAPEDLVTDEWAISAKDNSGNPVNGYLNIGFDGNDVYLQGLCTSLPQAWIKGTLDGTTITFAGNQYFGIMGNSIIMSSSSALKAPPSLMMLQQIRCRQRVRYTFIQEGQT